MDLDELLISLNQNLCGWATYFRYGVSKDTFSAVDHFTWGSPDARIRAKYKGKTGLSMKELRRRFCDEGWRFARNGGRLRRRIQRRVKRYRYRGNTIPTPWPQPVAAQSGD